MAQRGSFDDYWAALGFRESTDRYDFESRFGFLGRFQMGELALAEIGYYQPDGTAEQDYAGTWTGKNGITSKADFLANPAVQDAAAREYTDWNWQTLKRYAYDVYVGQTLNGHAIDSSGMLGATWLVGFEGMRDFLESGGTDTAIDAFGTPMLEYLALFNGYAVPARYVTSLAGDNAIHGGPGPDRLQGLGGDDTLTGGGGSDVAVFRGAGSEYAVRDLGGSRFEVVHVGGEGRDGTDTLIGIGRAAFADGTLRLRDAARGDDGEPEAPGDADGGARPESEPSGRAVIGTPGNDRLAGTDGADSLFGRKGDDLAEGARGADRLGGGRGSDSLYGRGGDDTVGGGHDDDKLYGGHGHDRLIGGNGRDSVVGGPGVDRLAGGAGFDILVGQGGDDRIAAGRDGALIRGGAGDDTMIAGAGGDRFVFKDAFGSDTVRDFDPAADVLDFSRTNLATVDILVRGAPDGAIAVETAEGRITLVGVGAIAADAIDIIV